MKILMINPNSDEQTDRIMEKKARAFAGGAYQVDVVHLKATPKLMKNALDAAAALPEMMELVQKGEQYDAFIDACHSDPNLEALRLLTHKPVVGIGEASMKVASMNCNGFAVISPSPASVPKKWTLAQKYYCGSQYKGAAVSRDDSKEALLQAAKQAVRQYYVDGIVLGCANYANADAYIEKRLGIPVFDGVACALLVASGMAMYKACKEKMDKEEERC